MRPNLLLAAALINCMACGGKTDASPRNDGGSGSGLDGGAAIDARRPPNVDASPPSADAATDGSSSESGVGGGYVDAGYYYGDGSYWVDGSPYPNLPDASVSDAQVIDSGQGCAPLASCCPTLTGASQSLCDSIAGAGNAGDCATELDQLEAGGECAGTNVLATQLQVPANRMVSDGTTLFWTTLQSSPGLFAMPVQGGPVATLLTPSTATPEGQAFLAVDDTNLYVLEGYSLVRIPKNGAPSTLVNESGATVVAATGLGGKGYWIEEWSGNGQPGTTAVKSAALLAGGAITTVGLFQQSIPPDFIAVTSTTAFLGVQAMAIYEFPLSGAPSSGPTMLSMDCDSLASDTNAAFCAATGNGSNQQIASDGTTSILGSGVSSTFIVSDNTYVYWADRATVGTILKAPKGGGGTATIVARDTNPTAIAVDDKSVYWSDQGGYIKSVPK
jgi:hypothetical protein